MHILKVGNQYVTNNGTLSDHQADAMRIDLTGRIIRKVKLTPHRQADTPGALSASDFGEPSLD